MARQAESVCQELEGPAGPARALPIASSIITVCRRCPTTRHETGQPPARIIGVAGGSARLRRGQNIAGGIVGVVAGVARNELIVGVEGVDEGAQRAAPSQYVADRIIGKA